MRTFLRGLFVAAGTGPGGPDVLDGSPGSVIDGERPLPVDVLGPALVMTVVEPISAAAAGIVDEGDLEAAHAEQMAAGPLFTVSHALHCQLDAAARDACCPLPEPRSR